MGRRQFSKDKLLDEFPSTPPVPCVVSFPQMRDAALGVLECRSSVPATLREGSIREFEIQISPCDVGKPFADCSAILRRFCTAEASCSDKRVFSFPCIYINKSNMAVLTEERLLFSFRNSLPSLFRPWMRIFAVSRSRCKALVLLCSSSTSF